MTEIRPVIVDYEAGNVRSVIRAVESLGYQPIISNDPSTISNADSIIFPGQGACDAAMASIKRNRLSDAIYESITNGTPYLGVCLGLQLLLQKSEEGNVDCLGILPGEVKRLPAGEKIPHMGWNNVQIHSEHPVFAGIPQNSHFYFVHSFYADLQSTPFSAATVHYGIEFCCAVANGNLVATQFHPEKSGGLGLQIYKNFLEFAENVKFVQ